MDGASEALPERAAELESQPEEACRAEDWTALSERERELGLWLNSLLVRGLEREEASHGGN
jgi:hypothetical protein